ncbi:MAG: MFS transporter [Planctomycetaceae bacterium]|nr:MFS transporter [Planctomycetaceae bacterium]
MASPNSTGNPPHRGTRREVFAWAMYDWANSAWSTILITVVVFYLTTVVTPSDWGPWFYGNGVGISMFVAALLSPVLGALADARAAKRHWLAITALGGAAAATLMGVLPPNPAWIALTLFFIANLGFELSYGICNGFLPEISDDTTVNRVSAWGFGAGYVGGGLALALALVVMLQGDRFGLPGGDFLTCDFNQSADAQFVVDVPAGAYSVELWRGDTVHTNLRDELRLNGTTSTATTTDGGRVSTEVTLHDGQLMLRLIPNGRTAQDVPSVVPIQGMKILGDGTSFAAQFDFGTRGSPVNDGYTQVTPETQYGPHEVKMGDELVELNFGWKDGDVTAVDAVNPLRMRIALVIGGLWWGLFSLPAVLFLRDKVQPRAAHQSVFEAARGAFAQVGQTLKHVRHYRTLALFLLGFLLFNDGMQTVISQASVFAKEELKMTTVDLIPLILMIQFVSLPGALFVGWLSDKIGQKTTLLATLAVWIGLVFSAFFVTTKGQFWVMGFVLALVMGGAQSVSRAIMGRMTPETRAAEFMGFFNFSGKATSILGPVLFANTLKATGSAHWAILSLLVFFVLGTLLVLPVNVERGQREALAEA